MGCVHHREEWVPKVPLATVWWLASPSMTETLRQTSVCKEESTRNIKYYKLKAKRQVCETTEVHIAFGDNCGAR